MKQLDLAAKLRINKDHLNKILNGHRKPSIELALAIEKASGGKYKATKLRPDMKKLAKYLRGE